MIRIACIFLAIILLLGFTRPNDGAAAFTQAASTTPTCGAGPVSSSLVGQFGQQAWADWIRRLSGETTVQVGGQTTALTTRYTPAMFWSGAPAASAAFDYVLEQVRQWYPEDQITQQDYPVVYLGYTGKNLILELPGTLKPDEVVILSAHLDSTSIQFDYTQAPGAEDNASGSAAMLEAARLLRDFRFERTLQIIWFTGEEQGLYGSSYFITHLPPGKTYTGVVNLDMFGYDSDDDHCFELHVGTLPASEAVGQCFTGTIQANGLPLSYDYLTSQAEGYSDHEPFWRIGIGAVEVLENHSTLTSQGGCIGADRNPYYHTVNDRIAQMNLAAGADIARAGVATAINLAGPTGVCGGGPALALSAGRSASQAQLTWSALQGAAGYRIWRSTQGCGGPWEQVGETSTPGQPWLDALPATNQAYVYQVQALGVEGCALSTCAPAHWPDRWYLPRISR